MQIKQEYEVRLDLFEGPLDLLLYLVNRSEVNIADIKVSQITSQYLDYLDLMRDLNIDIAADYLHMAAVLIRLKARELLPDQSTDEESGLEDGMLNREQLIASLLEYKKYKEAAGTLKTFESEQVGSYTRGRAEEIESVSQQQEVSLGSLSLFDLIAAFKSALAAPPDDQAEGKHVVFTDDVKLDDRIEFVLTILSESREVNFEDLFKVAPIPKRKFVMVVTFMAILELVKMKEIVFRQEKIFGNVYVSLRKDNIQKENTEQKDSSEGTDK